MRVFVCVFLCMCSCDSPCLVFICRHMASASTRAKTAWQVMLLGIKWSMGLEIVLYRGGSSKFQRVMGGGSTRFKRSIKLPQEVVAGFLVSSSVIRASYQAFIYIKIVLRKGQKWCCKSKGAKPKRINSFGLYLPFLKHHFRDPLVTICRWRPNTMLDLRSMKGTAHGVSFIHGLKLILGNEEEHCVPLTRMQSLTRPLLCCCPSHGWKMLHTNWFFCREQLRRQNLPYSPAVWRKFSWICISDSCHWM